MEILAKRIDKILGRDCPAIGGVSGEAISVIRELEARLDEANQLFADVCDSTDIDSVPYKAAYEGTYITDTIADYSSRESDNA